MKGRYKGKRVFLIGNGPSLNETPIYLLKNEFTLTFNRFSLLLDRINWHPNFYMTVDATVAENISEELNLMSGKCDYAFFPDIGKSSNTNFRNFVELKKNILFMHQEPFEFSNYLPYVGTGGSVIYEGFQVLNYLGFDKIYFIGVDMNYTLHMNSSNIKGNEIVSNGDDDPNHFDPRYFGKGKKYHQPTEEVVANIFNGLARLAKYFKSKNMEVVNCGYKSNVSSFPKQDFIKTLGLSPVEIDALFEDLVRKYNFESLDVFLKTCVFLASVSEWNTDVYIQSLPINDARDVIKKFVVDYLPLGPYKNRIYFLKRNQIN